MEITTTRVYEENFVNDVNYRIFVNRGGTRSGKTFNIMVGFARWLLTGQLGVEIYKEGVLSIVRKYNTTIKSTVQRDLDEILEMWGLKSLIKINKTDKTYFYQGRLIEFFGADDQQKLRGGKRDFLYCNEANELGYKTEFFQLNMRTRKKVFIDFNPDDEDVWINTELEQKRMIKNGDVKLIVSTYKDNCFLTDLEIKEIENIKNTDEQMRIIYGTGDYGKIEGLVFDAKEIKELPKDAELIGYGQDFGFTNDPSACIGVYRYNGELIFDEVFYKKGLTNNLIAREYMNNNISETDDIVADSAEPKSIKEISEYGYNIYAVEKGPDSIMFGINLLKEYKLNYTSRSINLKKEFKKYKRAETKDGKPLNKPIDQYNHGMDALRYLVMTKLKKDQSGNAGIWIDGQYVG